MERKIAASGHERVTHPDRGHDDIANAVCGVLVMARQRGVAMPVHRLQAYAIGGSYEPMATPEENALALAREERRYAGRGYFTGPGWAPKWLENGLHVQAYAEE